MNQLSDDQRVLVEAHLEYGLAVARSRARGRVWPRDLVDSAAFLGLCESALRYDPTLGTDFRTYCYRSIVGHVVESARAWCPPGRPAHEVLFDASDGCDPVGWEAESHDSFEELISPLQPLQRALLRGLYLYGWDNATVARLLGVSAATVNVQSRRAVAELRVLMGRGKLPMSLDDAQAMVRRGVPYGDVFPHLSPDDQPVFKAWYLDDRTLPNLAERDAPPPMAGQVEICQKCGAPAVVWTGTCKSCRMCGDSSGGCG